MSGRCILVRHHPFLSDVPENITLSSCTNTDGCFLGFNAVPPSSRHVVPIGKLKYTPFMSIFRFKDWWASYCFGSNGRDLKTETQMIMLDKSHSGRPYVVLLPILEGPFRASIQPGHDDNIDVCVESGSTKVTGASYRSVIYMHGGDDPFTVVKEAMKVAKAHLGTFNLLEEKTWYFGEVWMVYVGCILSHGAPSGDLGRCEGSCGRGVSPWLCYHR